MSETNGVDEVVSDVKKLKKARGEKKKEEKTSAVADPEVIFESVNNIIERNRRGIDLFVKYFPLVNGYFVVDPYNGKKLSRKCETEGEGVDLRNTILTYDQEILKKHYSSVQTSILLLKSLGYEINAPDGP